LTAASAVALNQGFRTCGTRIPLVVREGLRGVTRVSNFHFSQKHEFTAF